MKGTAISLIMILFFSVFTAGNTDSDTYKVNNGTYLFKEGTGAHTSYVTISDKNISFSYDVLSSNLPHGTFTINGNNLTMTTDDKRCKYVFLIDDNKLIFQKDESTPLSSLTDIRLGTQIPDHAKFFFEKVQLSNLNGSPLGVYVN